MSLLCTLVPLAILCGETKPIEDFNVYAGKSPFADVEGYRLLDHPRVRFSIELYVSDEGYDFLRDLDIGTPIELREGALITGLCARDACEDANAAVAIARDGGLVALCSYSKEEDHGAPAGKVHWAGPFLNRTFNLADAGTCPQDADSFLDRYARARQ